VLLGYKSRDITSHYSAPELKELIDAANRVCGQGDVHKTPTLTLVAQIWHMSLLTSKYSPSVCQPCASFAARGRVIELKRVGGLQHEYVRMAV
jgi:hypothetical protein